MAIFNLQLTFTQNGASNSSITPANTSSPFSMSLAVHTSLGNALFIGSDSIFKDKQNNIWLYTKIETEAPYRLIHFKLAS